MAGTAAAGAALLTGRLLAPDDAAAESPHPALPTLRAGELTTDADLASVRGELARSAQPWTGGWRRLVDNADASLTGSGPRAVATIDRGGSIDNFMALCLDAASAYQCALRWRLGDHDAYGARAARILNAWSSTLTSITGDATRFLLAGLQGAQLAHAAHLVRARHDFHRAACASMLTEIFYPMADSFLRKHNGAYDSNYWPSWDIPTMGATMAIGIVTDRVDLVEQAVTYFRHGDGLGSLHHAAPVLVEDRHGRPSLAQWIEVGRDQGHTMLGIGLMADMCEMAWNQGIDLYGHDDQRFLRAAQYVAKYNLGWHVPYPSWTWNYGAPGVWSGSQTFTAPSPDSRGQLRPVWDRIYGHYHGRLGQVVPYVAMMAAKARPDSGGSAYGSTSGAYDQLGFTTLTSYRR